MLEFDWDEQNLKHIAKHDVTAAEVEYVLENPTLDIGFQDDRGEESFKEAGATVKGRVLEVITMWRGMKTRVVAAYDASPEVADEYPRTR